MVRTIAALVVLGSAAAAIAYTTTPAATLEPGHADVLVVLGSPVDYTGGLLPMQRWRVNEAVQEYRRGEASSLIFSGGAAANRFVESEVMAREALRLGVPGRAILTETHSRTTLENIRNITPILQKHGWRRVEVISSADHLPRVAVLLRGAPFAWRTHAAPTPGRSRISRGQAYLSEAFAVLILRCFGARAEPLIHHTATAIRLAVFTARQIAYKYAARRVER